MSNQKPLIIPIFIPHLGCPHRCAFCDQSVITNKSEIKNESNNMHSFDSLTNDANKLPLHETLRYEVECFINFKGLRKNVQLAFFGGNFLGLEDEQISLLLSSAQVFVNEKIIDSIRFSTRPDTVTEKKLELINSYSVSTIELGVQSMNNRVLKLAQRGHTAEDTVKAASLLREYKKHSKQSFQIGMQMMVGLPESITSKIYLEDNDEFSNYSKESIDTAKRIASLNPDFVRIYPLVVLERSLIAKWYQQGKYRPMNIDSCVQLVKEIFMIFQIEDIPVIRMGLQASDLLQDKLSILAGPWHPAFGHLVYSEIFFDKAVALINKELDAKNKNCHYDEYDENANIETKAITLAVNPSSLSRLRGNKNHNIKRLKELYPSIDFNIKADISIDKNEIAVSVSSQLEEWTGEEPSSNHPFQLK